MISELVRAEVLGVDDAEYPTAAKINVMGLSGGEPMHLWAPLGSSYASGAGPKSEDGHGICWAPEKGDWVWVAFLMGDVNFPVIIGGGWEGPTHKAAPDKLPETLHVMASQQWAMVIDTDEPKILVRGEPDKDETATVSLGAIAAGASESTRTGNGATVKVRGALDDGFIAATPKGDVSVACKGRIRIEAGGTVTLSGKDACNAIAKSQATTDGSATLAPAATLIGVNPVLGA